MADGLDRFPFLEAAYHSGRLNRSQAREIVVLSNGTTLAEKTRHQIVEKQITGHTNGILVEYGDRALLRGNAVQTTKDGIVLINGMDVSIQDNYISCTRFGKWIGSERADITGNTMQGNYIGLLLGRYPIS